MSSIRRIKHKNPSDRDPECTNQELVAYGNSTQRKRIAKTVGLDNIVELLTKPETKELGSYAELWFKRHDIQAVEDARAVATLCQSHRDHISMTSLSASPEGVLPTFLHAGTPKMWIYKKARWITVREKGAIMGLPTSERLASMYGLPELRAHALQGGHCLFGNGQHMPNMAIANFALFACVCLGDTATVELPDDSRRAEQPSPEAPAPPLAITRVVGG